nr:FAD-dependent monooxygenase [Comamonas jiangduensis]
MARCAFATAVKHMEVHGDVDGSVHFDAGAQGVEALAWIVDVPALEQRLAEAVRYQPQVEVVDSPVQAPLTAICEGRASATRAEFGVDFDVTPYGQHAIATGCLRIAARPSRAPVVLSQGILALLPLEGADGHSVAVVWSVAQADAAHWQSTDEATFTQALSEISQSSLGQLQLQGLRMVWPLQQAVAKRWCGPFPGTTEARTPTSWVLAGDAAHNVHPLAGQGLNIGLADVQALSRILQARGDWRSTGDLKLLRRYERERKAGLAPLGLAMDGLQQLFTRPEAPVQALRNWGLRSFERSGLLKDWTARQAMGLPR